VTDAPPPPLIGQPPIDQPGQDAPEADDALSEAMVAPPFVDRSDTPPSNAPKAQSLVKSSLIYSSMTLISRFLGFGRDLVVTAYMGASTTVAADAWNTALAFPNLFRRIFAEGAFAAAFVPAYSKSLATDGEEVADILAADAMATLAAATIVLTLIAELTMPWLMMLISPGFVHDPVKYKLAVLLTQITMPYLPCMAIYAHLSGVLNARGKFMISAFAPALLNVGTLIAVLPQKTPNGAAIAAAIGAVLSGVAQAALLWWGVNKSGARVDIRLPRLTPEIRSLIGLAIPGAIAASVTQINIFISNFLASFVNGARSWLSVADRLYQLPLGLVGVAIGVALLPRLSTAVHRGDGEDAQSAMDEAVVFAMALTLPAAAALVAMPFFLIDGLFTRGAFHLYDADQTSKALFHYGWGTPAFVLARILSPNFFARKDTRSPMRFALLSVAVNIILGIVLFHFFGFEGIAAATAAAAWLNVFQMTDALAKRGHYMMSTEAMRRLAKIIVAAVVMGLVLGAASCGRPFYEHLVLRKEIALMLASALGVVVYFSLLVGLGAITPSEIRGALRRRPKTVAADDAGGGFDLT
jgi:putative peptidoglycan lipid II flippase